MRRVDFRQVLYIKRADQSHFLFQERIHATPIIVGVDSEVFKDNKFETEAKTNSGP